MSTFDKQTESAAISEDMSLQKVYEFVESVYEFVIPDRKEPGEHAFNVLDYYEMEEIGAYLKKLMEHAP
jgi:hypothetical protein